MKHQDVFRIMKRVLISGLLVLGILFSSPVSNVFAQSSASLRDAFRAYVTETPISKPLPTNSVVGIPTPNKDVGTSPPTTSSISNVTLASALRDLLKQKEFVAQLRGPQGVEGPSGPQGSVGPPGTNGSSNSYPAVIYTAPPAPAANFSGASYFSATNITSGLISADTAKVAELKVSSSLNVTGSSTLGALTVTSCTGCSPTTSLALSSAITDETGSGALVFSTSPTFITPVLGVATGTSLALGGGTALTTTNQTGTGNLVLATSPTLVTPVLGVASATSITTNGQGALQVGPFNTGAGQTGEGRFLELLANGTNYTGFKSPDSLAGNVIYTLPSADGTSGQVLTTSGAGVLSWTQIPSDIEAEGRLTLTSGTPVTTADVSAATTIYFAPYNGNSLSLYDGSSTWNKLTFAELSLNISSCTASKPYDIFIYNNSGTATMEMLVWTNDTTRATALVKQDEIYVKSGATTRRYIGTFYCNSSGGQTDDTTEKRWLFNYYNSVPRILRRLEPTASWSYTTTSTRQANGSTANQVDVVIGVAEVRMRLALKTGSSNTSANIARAVGIGEDSTTTFMSTAVGVQWQEITVWPANQMASHDMQINHYPAVGRHFYSWNENGNTGVTFYGDNQSMQGGLIGEIESSTGGADLAEEYLVHDESISAGDVVSLTVDSTGSPQAEKLYVEKASITSSAVIGIVSTKPGLTLKDWPGDVSPENVRAIALSGRVPVKISNENGEIKVGDRLTLSKTIPGYAMKQTDPGQSIGIAMEESTENIDKILVFVNLSYWAPGFGSFEVSEDGTPTYNSFFDSILSMFKNAFEIVFEKGILKVASLVVSIIKTEELEVKGAGVTVFDRTTGEPYCLGVDNGNTISTPGICPIESPLSEETLAPNSTPTEPEPESSEPSNETTETETIPSEITPEPETISEPTTITSEEPTQTEPEPQSEEITEPEPIPEPTSEPAL